MKILLALFLIISIVFSTPSYGTEAESPAVKLGTDLLMSKFHYLIKGKRIGLVTNQTGGNSEGVSTFELLHNDESTSLQALFVPDTTLGKTAAVPTAGTSLQPGVDIPVFSLSDKTPTPPDDMISGLDLMLVDLQDIGARSDPSLSAVYNCMLAAQKHGKPLIVLDRPNPLGGRLVEGPVSEQPYLSAAGMDGLPLAHGMTIGELALYFNRKIGANLTVIPMEGYTRNLIFHDTGLQWIPGSPDVPDLPSIFGYLPTSLGKGVGLFPADQYRWVGGQGVDSERLANLMNQANLPGVTFVPEAKDGAGGIRLKITDAHAFHPAKTGMYLLSYAHALGFYTVPKSDSTATEFDKTLGTNKIGEYLENMWSPAQIEAAYAKDLEAFKQQRSQYLIYSDVPHPAETPVVNNLSNVPLDRLVNKQPAGTTPPTTAEPEQQPGGKPAQTPGQPTVQDPAQKPAQQPAQQVPQSKPQQPAQPPNANPATGQGGKIAYLTFDDGPSTVTGQILDILKANQIKASFFVIGQNIKGKEAALKRAVAEGHTVGGHTNTHNYKLLYKDINAFFNDLETGNRLITQATGIEPTVFRFPGGSTNTVSKTYQDPKVYNQTNTVMKAIIAETKKRDYYFIDWNVSTGDASSTPYTAKTALDNVKRQVKGQKEVVILMHDSPAKIETVKALPEIIKFLQSQGYSFAPLHKNSTSVSAIK